MNQCQSKSIVSLITDSLYRGRIEVWLCRKDFKEAANALNTCVGIVGINYCAVTDHVVGNYYRTRT